MIRQHATLSDLQAYVASAEQDRGFADETAVQKCLLLGEEVGELFKAVRKRTGMMVDELNSSTHEVGSELADVLNYVIAIANRFDIDLEQAYIDKETINATRYWATNKEKS